ncbi:hypothetical protein [Pseudochryseolinea flava]|uniref:Uncharacterized protein n=1 Tax=Pseudochryseolinea flava TaxID=2059302 RepID=A0A364XWX3_9BACT|nr:hypothetical protein [Pseudochryseolinea flava]RAV98734.1 hypothetical protein DQQ10_22215 [Pseudochryseolinea flava]
MMRLMLSKFLVFVVLIGMGCSSGVIPCPKAKTVKMRKTNPNKRFFLPSESLSASAEEEKPVAKRSRVGDQKTIQNVTLEEWDCPKPGKKKYLPKKVKENIRKNMERVNAAQKDSLGVSTGNR